MKAPIRKPNINPVIFWDTDFNNIDYAVNAPCIIMRVFNYGTNEELREVIECYGYNYVVSVMIKGNSLESNGYQRAIKHLHIPPEKFKCYGRKLFR